MDHDYVQKRVAVKSRNKKYFCDHDYVQKHVALKSRNTKYCCVPQCRTYGAAGISFHLFPRDKILKKKWETALRMGKPVSSAMRVCSRHFQASNFFPNNSKRQKLLSNAVPSQNIPKTSSDKEVSLGHRIKLIPRENRTDITHRKIVRSKKDLGLAIKQQKFLSNAVPSQIIPKRSSDKQVSLAQRTKSISRENRADIRHRKIVLSKKDLELAIKTVKTDSKDGFEDNNITYSNNHHHVMTTSTQVNLADYRNCRPHEGCSMADFLCDKEPLEKCTQINFLPIWKEEEKSTADLKQSTLSDLLSNDANLFTFTGIHSIRLLESLVTCVSELASNSPTNKKILSVRDRVILTMVKIKQNMSFGAIGVLFGINRQTCANYFNNMLPILSRVIRERKDFKYIHL